MLYKCNDSDKSRVFEYVGDDYKNCLYAFADLKEYSLNESFINLWLDLDENNSIRGFIFNYHTGVHLYSHDMRLDINEAVELIKKINPTMINANKNIIEALVPYFEEYKHQYGYILKQQKRQFEMSNRVEMATPSDFHEMAEMLSADYGIGASYTTEQLENQIRERYEDNYGRTLLLRIDGHIAAQVTTGAEVDEFAVIIYSIVGESFRRQGLFSEVRDSMCYLLTQENKDIFCVCYEQTAMKAHGKLGNLPCCEWGKIFKEV